MWRRPHTGSAGQASTGHAGGCEAQRGVLRLQALHEAQEVADRKLEVAPALCELGLALAQARRVHRVMSCSAAIGGTENTLKGTSSTPASLRSLS